MRIGLDFDNTLICYDPVFSALARARGWAAGRGSKRLIKERLLKEDGNDLRWQALQAEAYGRTIMSAKPFPGAVEFLRRAREEGHELFIVSHKSEASHFDPSVRLRLWAKRWIAKHLRVAPSRCYFESTRAAKVKRIAELKLDLFVDDLEEVLAHPAFPATTAALRFDPAAPQAAARARVRSWRELSQRLCALDALSPEALRAVLALGSLPVSAVPVARSGNNRIFKLRLADGRAVLLKNYLLDGRDRRPRAASEFRALELMREEGLRRAPLPLYLDPAGRFALHSFLEGAPPARPERRHVLQAAAFISALAALKKPKDYPEAADSRRRLADYPAHLERRFKRAREGACELGHAGALAFLDERLKPCADRLTADFERSARAEGLRLDEALPDSERILSPSDFGFHNALAGHRGRLSFVDFEYFGQDDPAKLAADFVHHAAQRAPFELRRLFVLELAKSMPPGFARRFELVQDLIGLEWILIVLNVLAPEARARRRFSDPKLDERALVAQRLERAAAMLDSLEAGKRRLILREPALARR